jgi:hypothetical protein
LTTPSTLIGVDPSVFGMAIEDVEPTITEQILERISAVEGDLYDLSDDFKDLIIEKSLSTYIINLKETDFSLYDGVLIAYKQLLGVEPEHVLLFDSLYDTTNIELEVEQVSTGLIRVISTGSEIPNDIDIIAVKLSGIVINQSTTTEYTGTTDHRDLSYYSRSMPNQHPISSISELERKIGVHIGETEPVNTVDTWFDVQEVDGTSYIPSK